MPTLTTPEAIIHRAGVRTLPEYEDLSSITDGAGFYTFRRYPANSELAKVVTNDGRPAVRCYLAFIVDEPARGSHISRVQLKAWLARRWVRGRIFTTGRDPYAPQSGDPDAPSQQSALLLAGTRKPIDLDSTDARGYIYDGREDAFLGEDGKVVTPAQILEEMYTKHCRTLGLWFRIRWNLGSAARWAIREAVWKGQDLATWALFKFYDVELVDDKKDMRFSFFYKYKPSDFRRVTDKPGERSHFFGFQSSQKSFFTNLTVVIVVGLFAYWKAPRAGLLRVIYDNTALTTAALVCAFLAADTLGPWLLIRTICLLSRVRDVVFVFIRKVNV